MAQSMESFEVVREFDVIVFGASGFTGAYVVEELIICAEKSKTNDRELKWAVAGRSAPKLMECLRKSIEQVSKKVDHKVDWTAVKTFEANVNDESSLRQMTARTHVLINCVGPFRHYGHNVVKACVETNTCYVDICGEPQFLEEVQLTYYKLAQDKQIYIVPSCGFDSIPADLGVNFVKTHFNGVLDTVEAYLSFDAKRFSRANAATWDCIIDGYAAADQLKPIRKALFTQLFSSISKFRSKYPLKRRSFFQYTAPALSRGPKTGYCVPFPGSDRSVVRRTQMHNYLLYKERPVDFETYCVWPSIQHLLILILCAIMFLACVPFRIGRYLMHKFPEVFTFGVFTRKPISREEVYGVSFQMLFVGKGWKENLEDPLKQLNYPPSSTIYGTVSAVGPGYPATAACVVQAALALIFEKANLPEKGGVYNPGTAFRRTNIIEKLNERGVKFEILWPSTQQAN